MRIGIGFGLVISGCLQVLACGSSDERSDPQADGCDGDGPCPSSEPSVDVRDFCQRFIDEYARYIGNCHCGDAAVERFRQAPTLNCEPGGFFDNLVQAVEAGDLIYDAAAAELLFSPFYGPDPLCVEEPFRALELDSVEAYSFAGVFTGTHSLGEPCTLPVGTKGGVSDCREGICAGAETGSGVCVELVGQGQACDGSGDDSLDGTNARVCFERRPVDRDGEYASAFSSLSCIDGVCLRDLADGLACDSDEVCASGQCESVDAQTRVCAAKRADGEPCDSGGQCLSGACQYGSEPQVCGPLLADGQVCYWEDGACESGGCADDGSGTTVCGPRPSRGRGESCTASSECRSTVDESATDGVCFEGTCYAEICADYLE